MSASSHNINTRRETIEFGPFLSIDIHFGSMGGSLVLTDGTAIALGYALRRNIRYSFQNEHVTVSFPASNTAVSGRLDLQGDFQRSTMPRKWDPAVEELHQFLDAARCNATATSRLTDDNEQFVGPVVLVLGRRGSGKTSTCRTLLNLALGADRTTVPPPSSDAMHSGKRARDGEPQSTNGNLQQLPQERCITFVDTHLRGGLLASPGSIAATFLSRDSASYTIDDSLLSVAAPLNFFVGATDLSPESRKSFLDFIVHTLHSVRSVHGQRPALAAGGVIIDTMGWDDLSTAEEESTAVGAAPTVADSTLPPLYKDVVRQLMSLFGATDVVVCGADEALIQFVKEESSDVMTGVGRDAARLHVLRQPPLQEQSALVSRRDELRLRMDRCWERYFWGTARTPLTPFRLVVYIEDIVILDSETFTPMKSSAIQPLMVAAILSATTADLCSSANVTGYVVVTDVGENTLSLLSPAPGKLPRPFLMFGPVKASPQIVPSMAA